MSDFYYGRALTSIRVLAKNPWFWADVGNISGNGFSRAGRDRAYKERKSVSARIRKYGVTEERLAALYLNQDGICPICDESLGEDITIDHNHKNKIVRGIVHRNCNVLIGFYETVESSIMKERIQQWVTK